MPSITFEVLGNPMGKQRPRLFFANGKNIVYTPQKTKNYEKQVREAYLEKTNIFFNEKIPVEIEILAYYEIPKTLEKSARIEVIERAIKPLKKPARYRQYRKNRVRWIKWDSIPRRQTNFSVENREAIRKNTKNSSANKQQRR